MRLKVTQQNPRHTAEVLQRASRCRHSAAQPGRSQPAAAAARSSAGDCRPVAVADAAGPPGRAWGLGPWRRLHECLEGKYLGF